FAHELVEGIARFLLVSLRRPELAAARLLSEGLILVHPPKPHGRAQAENYTRTRPYPSLVLSLLAKQVLLNLSAPRHREGVDEEDGARDFEASEAISQAVERVLLGQHRAGFLDHERDGTLREPLIRHADDGDVVDPRVLEQEALDLCRVDVLAPDLEEILVAAEEAHTSVGAHQAAVAGVQPAVGVDRLGSLLRILIVPLHHLIPAHADFAHLSRRLGAAADRIDDL